MVITNSTTLPHNNFLVNLVPVFTVRFCAYLWVEILEHHAVNMHATPNRHYIYKDSSRKILFTTIPLNRDSVNRKIRSRAVVFLS